MSDVQRKLLFDVYYLARFNRDVALALGARAGRADTAAAALVVLSLLGSLVAGGLTFGGSGQLQPVWALLNIVATVFGVWALIRSYSQRQYEHYNMGNRFEALMLRVEAYAGYATRATGVTAVQIDDQAIEFRNEYNTLMGETGAEHKRYGDKHEAAIQRRLDESLRRAGKI